MSSELSADGALLPLASGNRKDYALGHRPLARGGQATVFAATHKPTGRRVAFKRINGNQPAMVARMRREIEAAQLFGGHRHVMPVLDHSRAYDWFVMPLAGATASTRAADLARPEALRELVEAVCAALRVPHEQGWIHRDLKPDNLLWLDDRWVVADWGLGRRPRGKTTDAGRTRTGTAFGTEGFAAPELAVDAHAAGPQADVYSIGQIIGWALTGTMPHANIPLLPAAGPWRTIVKAATVHDVRRRLAGVDDLLATMAAELDNPDAVVERGRQFLAAAAAGDPEAAPRLLRLAAQSDEHFEALRDDLLGLETHHLRAAVTADPASIAELVRMLRGPDGTGAPERGVAWLLVVAGQAETAEQRDLLDETIDSLLVLSGRVTVEAVLAGVAGWMAARRGQAASELALAVRRTAVPAPVREAVAAAPGTDAKVRRALRSRPRAASSGAASSGAASAPGAQSASGSSASGSSAVASSAGPRRSRRRLLVSASVVAVLTASGFGANRLIDWPSSGFGVDRLIDRPSSGGTTQGTQGESDIGLPDNPVELAQPGLAEFVAPWKDYPGWVCRTETNGEVVNGSFPARPAQAVDPTEHIRCANSTLVAMFASFHEPDYDTVWDRYLAAPRPDRPVGMEAGPPDGLHVFAWSPTHRALVWGNRSERLIGMLITKSQGTDLVELWQKYPV